tara:strand:- start:44 stop:454 length:411 start_codon:yes stop_codon:yes gene_type:complete
MNILKSSGFTTSSVNGNLINEQGYNAEFDGENALIKTLNNGKFKEFILDKKEINHILGPFYKNKFNTNNNDLLLTRLGNEYDLLVEPKEYYNNLKSVDSELKDLFIDISKIKKKTLKTKERKNKKAKKNKTNKKKK